MLGLLDWLQTALTAVIVDIDDVENHGHFAACRRELDTVSQEIKDELAVAALIAVHRQEVVFFDGFA